MMLHLLSDNRKLSFEEIVTAKKVCDISLEMISERDNILKKGDCDKEFILPSANWSHDAPNEYLELFNRVVQADPVDLNHLRGFTQVFSGYNLFRVLDGKGLVSSDLCCDDQIEAELKEALKERNKPFVDEWHTITEAIYQPFLFNPPGMLGEVGHVCSGVIVNSDTCTYQERINLMLASGLIEWVQSIIEQNGELRVLEIGGGYGAFAYWLKGAFPNVTYISIDLPESLLFAQLYLSLTRPDIQISSGIDKPDCAKYGIRFIPNYLAHEVNQEFDLIINTLSMSEMSEYQVTCYLERMANVWLKEGGLFFEQNQDNRQMGCLFAQEMFSNHFPHRQKIFEDKTLRNGFANIWSFKPFHLNPKALPLPNSSYTRIIEEIGHFNLIETNNGYWCLDQRLGKINPYKLEIRDYPPVIFYGETISKAKSKIFKI